MSHRFTRSLTLLLLLLLAVTASGQAFNQIDEEGNVTRRNEDNRNFNPHNTDTTSNNRVVPKGIYTWVVDRRFGDISRVDVDTLPHLYPQSTLGPGMHGHYNTVGSNFTARQSRIFTDRRTATQSFFTDVYSQVLRQPDEWHFTNTLSPITNLSYGSCGDKTNGEDLIDARFATNAGKKTGLGFDLDYRYARGYFQNQNNSHFNASFYVSHLGDRYQLHLLFQNYHQKATENGGITNDNYITHPELYTESYSDNEIPTILSQNWNRNDHQRLFLTHRYSVGFYRKVPMTEEEKKAKQFALDAAKEKQQKEKKETADEGPAPAGRPDDAKIAGDEPVKAPADSIALATDSIMPADSLTAGNGRISVDSKEMADSLIRAEQEQLVDSADLFMKREFVPVTSFIHTAEVGNYSHIYQAYAAPADLYANTYYAARDNGSYQGDSIYDKTRLLSVKNTLAVALLEGFNKYAPAGLKAFASHELRRFDMPDLLVADTSYMSRWNEHNVSVGGQLSKQQGSLLHYDVTGEFWLGGEDAGQLKLDAKGDLNFRLLGDTVRLDARAWMHRVNPLFYQRRYHSKHLWWDNDLNKETRSHLEGKLTYSKTNTSLRVALDEIENYTYLGMSYAVDGEKHTGLTAAFQQHDASLTVLTAQLDQKLSLGPLHWDNIITFQTSSDQDVVPLPKLNVFTNLYLQFMVAHVLRVELGASGTWFSKYNAPDFLPQLNQFAVQQNADSRQELGNFPFIDVYANLHLKHARFFIMMNNATGTNFDRMAFLVPHYPQNRSVLRLGVSWNFFN
ncbi:MAG: putative porin [Prevotella sp.]|nr:putative porin [Prevotella sp.]